ncbi:EF-hand domain-containing protein [Dokdonella sp.]|uniref:EF-hand domain-containing protein n=1 Tax=Dokdonella sp. TaxID=2291710 RepID=UPI0025BA3293|nr:EF-hand domain-containing protein [Dokdonella sp.]MBX3693479.1 EF-hand domain-containing protein [Dokdonella sp.]MCW5567638.1 EF-hand domain-containing protein [Dokdonella sp.]
MSSKHVKPVGIAIGTALLGSLSLAQLAVASDGFKASDLGRGYVVAMAGDKAKEGKCGEGKCGEGKCGFAKLDANGDGAISADEWNAAKPDKADKWAKLDADGDGKVTREEWDAAHKAKEGKCGEGKCGEGKCGGSAEKKG